MTTFLHVRCHSHRLQQKGFCAPTHPPSPATQWLHSVASCGPLLENHLILGTVKGNQKIDSLHRRETFVQTRCLKVLTEHIVAYVRDASYLAICLVLTYEIKMMCQLPGCCHPETAAWHTWKFQTHGYNSVHLLFYYSSSQCLDHNKILNLYLGFFLSRGQNIFSGSACT